MYKSLKPLYEKLHEVLNAQFGPDASMPVLKSLDRGFSVTVNRGVSEYPFGFLEWGLVSDVALYNSPEEYEYEVTYRLFILVTTGADVSAQVFRPTGDTESELGIGDFCMEIVDFFWENHHTSRFSVAWEDSLYWRINNFSVDGGIVGFSSVSDATLASIQRHLQNDESVRALQLNFTFQVIERVENWR